MPLFRNATGRKADGRTLLVALTIYGGWIAVTACHATLPKPVVIMLGGWLIAWHGLLQHETVHGHPTRNQWVNGAIGFPPLSLWLPYGVYHRSHIAHHRSPAVTHPHFDPESRYHDRRRTIATQLARLQSTLIGHLVLGPPISILRFLAEELARAVRDPAQTARDWIPHLLGVALIL